MAVVVGSGVAGLALATAPVWMAAAAAFLAAHPGIPAAAFWAVLKALARRQSPTRAGIEAGIDATAVETILAFARKWLWFLPRPEG